MQPIIINNTKIYLSCLPFLIYYRLFILGLRESCFNGFITPAIARKVCWQSAEHQLNLLQIIVTCLEALKIVVCLPVVYLAAALHPKSNADFPGILAAPWQTSCFLLASQLTNARCYLLASFDLPLKYVARSFLMWSSDSKFCVLFKDRGLRHRNFSERSKSMQKF